MKKQAPAANSENTLVAKSSKRQGDWVCMMCNNLNYSFRNTCNRCKNVTREENSSLAKTQKEREPLGEITLNRHSSYQEEIHHNSFHQEQYLFRSHSKKLSLGYPLISLN